MSAAAGATVTITGTDFVGVDLVSFYDYPTSFTVVSATQITATVPAGTPSPGRWRVRTSGGLAVHDPLFTVTNAAPTITSVSPMNGPVGSRVTITGTNFASANLVSFYDYPTSFTLVSATQITATVPAGTPSPGRWRVGNPNGLAVHSPLFSIGADITAPTAPSGLAVSARSSTSITLGWIGSTDNVAVSGYGRYRNNTLLSSGAGTSFNFTGLSCGTSYTLAVDAADAAGNRSAQALVTASTSACVDTLPPSAPGAIGLGTRTQTSIAVTWGASTDNVAVNGYGVYRNNVSVGSTAPRRQLHLQRAELRDELRPRGRRDRCGRQPLGQDLADRVDEQLR